MDVRDLTLLVPLLALSCIIVNASVKKGVAVNPNNYICGDLAVLNNIAWWYDWGPHTHFIDDDCDFSPYINKYVPMIWGYNTAWYDKANYYVEENTDYILGFNEPNHVHQTNLEADRAVEGWPYVEAFANGSRIIIGPSVARCGSSCVETDEKVWLDDFFRDLCNTDADIPQPCRMQYLGFHHYPVYKVNKHFTSCSASKTMTRINELYDRYNMQIWLTEFACAETDDPGLQLEYMKALLPLLEESPAVFRYSWFVTRVTNVDNYVRSSADLFERGSSTLTPLGEYYNSFTYGTPATTTTSTSTSSSTSTTSTTSSTTSTTSTTSTSTTTTTTTPTTTTTTSPTTTKTTSPTTRRQTTTEGSGGSRSIPLCNIVLYCVSYLLMLEFCVFVYQM